MTVTAISPPRLRAVPTDGLFWVTHLTPAYETWLRSWGATDATIQTRMSTCRALDRDGIDPLTVSADELTTWIASHGWSGWTLSTYFSSLRSIFGWLRDAGHRTDDPTSLLRRPRPPRSQPRPLTATQCALLMDTATPRVRAYLTLALYAGLRAHEIAKVRGEDVDSETIFVEGKGGQRLHVPTHPVVWSLAQEMPRQGYWFASDAERGHVSREAISHAVGRHMRRHGVAGSIHRARHSYASTLLRSGVNIRVVQTLMRHQSIQSTQAYTAVDEAERMAAIARLDFAA